MPNDVPMLRWAGHGAAIATRTRGSRSASFVAPAYVDDGVAQVVERLLAEQGTPSVSLPSDSVARVNRDDGQSRAGP